MDVNGTLIWYYNICKREVWLMAHNIVPDQQNEDIDYGRFLHEHTFQKKQKEIVFGNVKFDVLLEKKDRLVIGETKKSSRFQEASRWQLLFYLQVLQECGINASGCLLYPEEKKRVEIELTAEAQVELEAMIQKIVAITTAEQAPEPQKCKYCGKCGYEEYCWS